MILQFSYHSLEMRSPDLDSSLFHRLENANNKSHYIILFIKKKNIYLAAPGLSHSVWGVFSSGMQALICSIWDLVP